MQDATTLVYSALNTDTTLVSILGGKNRTKGWNRIYNSQVAPNADEYPRVTMFEVLNEDEVSADDEPQFSEVNIRIDVWAKDVKNIFSTCKQIKKILKNNFYTCNVRLEETMYEQSDTDTIYHKPVNVYLLIEQGE